jgi:hypothetical protein
MTQLAIKQQIADIHTATTRATKSPTAALKFLRDAGIIQQLPKSKKNSVKSVLAKKK